MKNDKVNLYCLYASFNVPAMLSMNYYPNVIQN